MNPDLKVYATEIYIDGNDPMLRTGMSCQAEIIIQQYKDVVSIPLQAVIRVGDEPTVYVKNGNTFQPKQIKAGLDNNKVIHILEGLKEGDVILLNPPLKSAAVYSQSQKNVEEYGDGMQAKITDGLKKVELNRISAEPNRQQNIESAEIEKQKERFKNLTPQQREEMRKKVEQTTPAEREKSRQTHDGNRPQGSGRQNAGEQKQ